MNKISFQKEAINLGDGAGEGFQDRGDTCLPMADSYLYMAKHHNIVN